VINKRCHPRRPCITGEDSRRATRLSMHEIDMITDAPSQVWSKTGLKTLVLDQS